MLEEEIKANLKAYGKTCNWWTEVFFRHQPDPFDPQVRRIATILQVRPERFRARLAFIKRKGTYVCDEAYLTQFLVDDYPELSGKELAAAVRRDLDAMMPNGKLHQLFEPTVEQAEKFRDRLNTIRMQ